MTVIKTCDWCHEPIMDDEPSVEIIVKGDFARGDMDRRPYLIGNYHSLPDEDSGDPWEAGCFNRVWAGIRLIHNAGDAIEQIPTISNRAIAARRRRHTKQGEEA
jgi:hypothetical protein